MSLDVEVARIREWLWPRIEAGTHCPACGQYVKIYRRKINSGMAVSLIGLYRPDRAWVHVPTAISARSREEGKLRYWGLVEESGEVRDDGGRSGWWRITDRGISFVHDGIRVPKYALVYDGRVLRLVGDQVGIRDALGTRFDYGQLMAGL